MAGRQRSRSLALGRQSRRWGHAQCHVAQAPRVHRGVRRACYVFVPVQVLLAPSARRWRRWKVLLCVRLGWSHAAGGCRLAPRVRPGT